jgi:hypothetical protein
VDKLLAEIEAYVEEKKLPVSVLRVLRQALLLSTLNPDIDFNQDGKKELHIRLCAAVHALEDEFIRDPSLLKSYKNL